MKLPTGWKETTLSEIFEFEKKSGVKAGEGENIGKYKFFTSSGMQSKYINSFTFDGEYLIFGTGGQASIHYCKEKFSTSTDCFVVGVSKVVLPKYVYYFIKSKMYLLEEGFKGAGLKHISKEYIKNIKIVFPETKETQNKIVSLIEKVEKLQEKKEKANKLSILYIQNLFRKMFGDPVNNEKKWGQVSLGEICEIKTGGTPSRKENAYWGGDIPWVKTTELRGSVIHTAQETITKMGEQNSNATVFPKDTILVAMYGQGKTMGRTAKLGINAATNQACAALLPSKSCETEFIWQYLILSYDQLRKLAKGGNQPNLNLKILRDFKIYDPPLKLQKDFSTISETMRNLNQNQIKSQVEINHLFNSLIEKAFSGKLVM